MYSKFHFKTFARAPELISRCVSERNKKNSHIYFHSGVYIVHTLVFALFFTKFFYTRFMFASSSINFISYCETGELTVSHFRSNPLQCDKCWFAIYLFVCSFAIERDELKYFVRSLYNVSSMKIFHCGVSAMHKAK